ncbi:MAG: hypothetical protein K2F89_04250, partial [Treponemataceae bacterium]|nr:hypothetical protein [Treponemataceae bacterium]
DFAEFFGDLKSGTNVDEEIPRQSMTHGLHSRGNDISQQPFLSAPTRSSRPLFSRIRRFALTVSRVLPSFFLPAHRKWNGCLQAEARGLPAAFCLPADLQAEFRPILLSRPHLQADFPRGHGKAYFSVHCALPHKLGILNDIRFCLFSWGIHQIKFLIRQIPVGLRRHGVQK